MAFHDMLDELYTRRNRDLVMGGPEKLPSGELKESTWRDS